MGNFFEDIVDLPGDFLDDAFDFAIDLFGLKELAEKNRARRNTRFARTAGAEFESSRPTATSVRSAREQGPLQPGGTRKFVVPRERKRKRGLVSEFNLGNETAGSGAVNVGTGATFSL